MKQKSKLKSNPNSKQKLKPKPKQRNPLNDQRHTAIHEAGHAVIARVLTFGCGGASVVIDHESAGHAIVDDPETTRTEWDKRGRWRCGENAHWYGHIIALMAGAEAEVVLLGKTHGGDGNDCREIEKSLCNVSSCRGSFDDAALEFRSRIEARLRKRTRWLVQRHRARIETVASALLAKHCLSREEVDELAGRSIDDIVPDWLIPARSPFLNTKNVNVDESKTARKRGPWINQT